MARVCLARPTVFWHATAIGAPARDAVAHPTAEPLLTVSNRRRLARSLRGCPKRREARRMEFAGINGAAMRYELSGAGERTIVLVHEMGGTLESWDGIAPRFAESRRVLRYDFRGSGLSQKVSGELSIDTMADDIAALLYHTKISGKVALAGVAVGGAVALHFAARHPARASAVAAGSPATGIAQDRRAAVLERVAKLEASGMAFAVEDSMRNGYPDELTKLKCPVLVFGALFDRTRPPAISKAIADTIPGARFEEIRTGHYMAA